jgi:hypothetical protein
MFGGVAPTTGGTFTGAACWRSPRSVRTRTSGAAGGGGTRGVTVGWACSSTRAGALAVWYQSPDGARK